MKLFNFNEKKQKRQEIAERLTEGAAKIYEHIIERHEDHPEFVDCMNNQMKMMIAKYEELDRRWQSELSGLREIL